MKARRWIWVVLAIAVAVRVWGLGFGLPAAMARPDETQIAGPAAVRYLAGNFEPQFFQWPTLFSYTVALAYAAYVFLGRPFHGFTSLAAFAESRRQSLAPFFYISRGLSALFGVATVWWVYAIGRRIFDETVGLVAALFLALAFLHVRDSHFGVTDIPMTALVVCAVLLILRWHERGGFGAVVAAGLVSGLAGSTKYNGLGTAAPFAVAWVFRTADAARPPRVSRLGRQIAEGVAYTVAMAAGFFGASPYILLEWSRFRADTGSVQSALGTGNGVNLGPGWWYYAHAVLPAAIGWPMLLAAAAGIVVLLITRPRVSLVLLAFPISYYMVAGRGYAVFARYILPVVPFLCLTAAWFVVWAARRVAHTWPVRRRGALIAVATLALIVPSAVKVVQLDRLFTATDNRVVTAEALNELVPPGSLFYQTDRSYGNAPLDVDVRAASFDPASGSFNPGEPDWVLVQRSPLVLYSRVPDGLQAILDARYTLVRSFRTETSPPPPGRIYDQQDAFFLPLTKLGGLKRPGPAFDLYAKRDP